MNEEIEKGINHLKNYDKKLSLIIEQAPEFVPLIKREHYWTFVESILSQQLAGAAARAITGRVKAYFNNKPTAQLVVNAPAQDLRDLGVSWAKIRYIKDLSEKKLSGEIHFRGLQHKSDQQIIDDFIKVKGIGVWTVHMYLIFNLARLNVLPIGDLGIKKGAMLVYGLKKLPDENKIIQLSRKNNWSPYNSLASWYLWKALELKPKKSSK